MVDHALSKAREMLPWTRTNRALDWDLADVMRLPVLHEEDFSCKTQCHFEDCFGLRALLGEVGDNPVKYHIIISSSLRSPSNLNFCLRAGLANIIFSF